MPKPAIPAKGGAMPAAMPKAKDLNPATLAELDRVIPGPTATATGAVAASSFADEFEAAWKAETALVDGEDVADGYEAAHDRAAAIAGRILHAPARTLDDFRTRARAVLWCYGNDRNELLDDLRKRDASTAGSLVHSIIRDLIDLGGRDHA